MIHEPPEYCKAPVATAPAAPRAKAMAPAAAAPAAAAAAGRAATVSDELTDEVLDAFFADLESLAPTV